MSGALILVLFSVFGFQFSVIKKLKYGVKSSLMSSRDPTQGSIPDAKVAGYQGASEFFVINFLTRGLAQSEYRQRAPIWGALDDQPKARMAP
jgi:hypothetical protein